jgi:hypothetical protein
MVTARLSLEDAKEKGWLLDGYPRSSAQAESLEKLNVRPDIYVVLDVRKTMMLSLLMIMPDNDIAPLPMRLLGIYSPQNLLENTPILAQETEFSYMDIKIYVRFGAKKKQIRAFRIISKLYLVCESAVISFSTSEGILNICL